MAGSYHLSYGKNGGDHPKYRNDFQIEVKNKISQELRKQTEDTQVKLLHDLIRSVDRSNRWNEKIIGVCDSLKQDNKKLNEDMKSLKEKLSISRCENKDLWETHQKQVDIMYDSLKEDNKELKKEIISLNNKLMISCNEHKEDFLIQQKQVGKQIDDLSNNIIDENNKMNEEITSIKNILEIIRNENKDNREIQQKQFFVIHESLKEAIVKMNDEINSLKNKMLILISENKENCGIIRKQFFVIHESLKKDAIKMNDEINSLKNKIIILICENKENCGIIRKQISCSSESLKEDRINNMMASLTNEINNENTKNCEIYQKQINIAIEKLNVINDEVISLHKNVTHLRTENKDNCSLHQKQIYGLSEALKEENKKIKKENSLINEITTTLRTENTEYLEINEKKINGLYELLKDDNMKLKNEFTILCNENKDNWKMYHEKDQAIKTMLNEVIVKQKEIKKYVSKPVKSKLDKSHFSTLNETLKNENKKFDELFSSIKDEVSTLRTENKENWQMYLVACELEKGHYHKCKLIFEKLIEEMINLKTKINQLEETGKEIKDLVNQPEINKEKIGKRRNSPSTLISNGSNAKNRKRKKSEPVSNLADFFKAISNNNIGLVGEFLKANPELINIKNDQIPYYNPLLSACNSGHHEMVRFLIDHGSNIVLEDFFHSPLGFSAKLGHLNVIKALIGARCDVNARDANGDTPLHSASLYGHLDVIEYLIKAGANTTLANDEGFTAMHYAQQHARDDVIRLLEDNQKT